MSSPLPPPPGLSLSRTTRHKSSDSLLLAPPEKRALRREVSADSIPLHLLLALRDGSITIENTPLKGIEADVLKTQPDEKPESPGRALAPILVQESVWALDAKGTNWTGSAPRESWPETSSGGQQSPVNEPSSPSSPQTYSTEPCNHDSVHWKLLRSKVTGQHWLCRLCSHKWRKERADIKPNTTTTTSNTNNPRYPFTNINFTETNDENANNPFLNVLYNWSGQQQQNNPDPDTLANTNTNSNTNNFSHPIFVTKKPRKKARVKTETVSRFRRKLSCDGSTSLHLIVKQRPVLRREVSADILQANPSKARALRREVSAEVFPTSMTAPLSTFFQTPQNVEEPKTRNTCDRASSPVQSMSLDELNSMQDPYLIDDTHITMPKRVVRSHTIDVLPNEKIIQERILRKQVSFDALPTVCSIQDVENVDQRIIALMQSAADSLSYPTSQRMDGEDLTPVPIPATETVHTGLSSLRNASSMDSLTQTLASMLASRPSNDNTLSALAHGTNQIQSNSPGWQKQQQQQQQQQQRQPEETAWNNMPNSNKNNKTNNIHHDNNQLDGMQQYVDYDNDEKGQQETDSPQPSYFVDPCNHDSMYWKLLRSKAAHQHWLCKLCGHKWRRHRGKPDPPNVVYPVPARGPASYHFSSRSTPHNTHSNSINYPPPPLPIQTDIPQSHSTGSIYTPNYPTTPPRPPPPLNNQASRMPTPLPPGWNNQQQQQQQQTTQNQLAPRPFAAYSSVPKAHSADSVLKSTNQPYYNMSNSRQVNPNSPVPVMDTPSYNSYQHSQQQNHYPQSNSWEQSNTYQQHQQPKISMQVRGALQQIGYSVGSFQ